MSTNSAEYAVNNDREKFFKVGNQDVEVDKFAVFEQWLLQNGTVLPKLELREYGDEVRGCHAKEQIQNEEVIIEVPLKCLITVEMGKETELGRAIASSRLELDAPKHIFLMIYMLLDRTNPKSFFKPYYDILPKTLYNMPIFWNEHELKYLQGSYLLDQIDERNIAIEADYLSICKLWPDFRSVATLDDFKWARMCVCSRNFGLVINGIQTAAMVPYADMLNHYRPRETKWQFDDEVQSFTVVSLQPIACGAQVYDSYGRKCNHRFLLNYGFSVENNIESDGTCPNEVPVLLEVRKSDPLFELKCSYYRRDLSIPSRRVRVAVADTENTKTMLAMLRVIECDKEDFDLLIALSGNSIYRSLRDANLPISVHNEVHAMTALLHMCDHYLHQYPTTYEKDCHRLQCDEHLAPFSNERHAVIQIKGEKEVLLYYKDFAVTSLALLNARDQTHFEEMLEEVRHTKHPFIYQHCHIALGRLLREEQRRAEQRARRKVDLSRPTVV